MCGIYGFQVRPGHHLSTFEATAMTLTLASEMESRGRESFGGALWTPDAIEPVIIKDIGKVTEKGSRLLRSFSECAWKVLGHTRQSTVGSVCPENSHPFTIGDILGVHNGMVWNHSDLWKKYPERSHLQVDSQHIFAHLDSGLDLSEIDGYGAIMWAKKSEKYAKLYFARTDTGSFFIARLYRPETPRGEREDNHIGVVWASTLHAITAATERAGLEYACITYSGKRVYYVEDGEGYDANQDFTMSTHTFRTDSRTSGGRQWEDWDSGSRHPHYGAYTGRSIRDMIEMTDSDSDPNTRLLEVLLEREDLTKRQRKRLRKALETQLAKRASTRPTDKPNDTYFAPVGEHATILRPKYRPDPPDEREPWSTYLVPAQKFPRVFTQGGKSEPLCPSCGSCKLKDHVEGWCASTESTCKCPSDLYCNNGLYVCADCRCYLIEGIHSRMVGKGDQNYRLHCDQCGQDCLPKHDRDRRSKSAPTPEPEEGGNSVVVVHPNDEGEVTAELDLTQVGDQEAYETLMAMAQSGMHFEN
jgi:predicted glutamine amidotransferase